MKAQASDVSHHITHEAERIARAPIVWVAIWATVFSIVLAVVALILFHVRSNTIEGNVSAGEPRPGQPVQPVSSIRTNLFHYQPGDGTKDKARQRRELEHFGWVDREQGIVRIPIDTAIDLELAEPRP
jgi:hypothetical protein